MREDTTVAARSNLDYWREYGDYVLMAMPYADQVLVEGRGCTLRDADGNEILDLASGMFCCVLGHNHPRFIEKVMRQTERLLHTGTQYLAPAVLEASQKLAQVTPGRLQKSIFLSTGTEANEFAFRVAKAYTGRTGIVGLSRGYYGTSLATKSCSSLFSHSLKDSLPSVPDSYRLPITPKCVQCFSTAGHECSFPCLDSVESWIGDWSNIAAVIVEPVLSAGGMLIPPAGYFQRLKAMAEANGALFIVDEAQTGFGRTGKWFAIEHHDVEPDILTMSKSIGNGYPVAGVITRPEIADKVVADGLWNLSSHQSDPVAAAAVSAVIEVVGEENLLDVARDMGQYFVAGLMDLSTRQPAVRNVRGQGLMIGFDIAPADADTAVELATGFMYLCRRSGLHLTYGYGSVNIRIIPPLVITRQEIDRALDIMERCLQELHVNPNAGRQCWPTNPHTRSLVEQHPMGRLLQRWWKSSPEEWVDKGSKVIRAKLGSGK